MTFSLAVQENLVEGRTLQDRYAFALQAGFDGIELRGAGDRNFQARLPEIRAARAAGVRMPTVCAVMDEFIGDFDSERRTHARDQIRALLSTIAEAGGFGTVAPASYGMFSRRLPPFTPPREPEADREILLDQLGTLGEHATEAGAFLLLEPLNRYEDYMVNTLADAVDLIREVGLPSVAVAADLYHMNIEESKPFLALSEASPHVRHIQIGDTNRLEPGAGHLDWAAFRQTIGDIGYDGWLAMECRLSGPPAEVLPRVSTLLRE